MDMEDKMNWEETKQEATKLGFTFEEQTWIPDGYQEDEDGEETSKLITEPVTQLKVMFPTNYPHPAQWIDIGDVNALQYFIDEYLNRYKIAEETKRHNKEVEQGMNALMNMFNHKRENDK